MNERKLSHLAERAIEVMVIVVIALVITVLPLAVVSRYFPSTLPVFFIVAGLMVFLLPGLFNRDADQSRGMLSAYAHRCYQLIQDEDPKMAGTASLAKFQMLFWTITLATSYVWLLLKQQPTAGSAEWTAPTIPDTWLVLMGISNGTYILAKVAKTFKEGRVQPQKNEDKPKEKATGAAAGAGSS